MPRLRLSARARRDLEEIQDAGLRDFGLRAVRDHMAGFERIFQLLRDHPLAGQERPDFGRDIRTLSHRPHRVLYQVRESHVLIVRILHQARDVRRALERDQ